MRRSSGGMTSPVLMSRFDWRANGVPAAGFMLRRDLERAESAAEGDLRLVVQRLPAEDEDRVLVERGADLAPRRVGHGPADVDAVDAGREVRCQSGDRDAHRPLPHMALELLARHRLSDPGEPARVLHLARALDECRQRQSRQRAADADALDARLGELSGRERGIGGAHHDIERLAHRRGDRADRREVAQAGGVEDVGAGLVEGLQPADGVVEVDAPVQQVLRPRRQHERDRQRPRHLHRRLHPLDREVEVVDRLVRLAGGVLDGAADHAGLGGEADHLGRGPRLVGVAILQIGVDRQVRGAGDEPAVVEDFAAAHGVGPVRASQRVGQAEARRRQRLEPECRQDPRGAGVPGVGNDERAGSHVQRPERDGLLGLRAHGRSPPGE